jgi:pimeloyl-ACP methyl ester carboxylesterase
MSTSRVVTYPGERRLVMKTNEVSVVLAHGAWADGSSWVRVIGPLAAAGHKVSAPSLPLTSFEADVAAVERALERVAGQIVLVAHAYAGAVIGATRNERVQALVYIAALAPDEGETVADVFYRAPPHARAPKLSPDSHGVIYLPESAFAEAFAPNATAEEQALLAALQRPIAPACITTRMGSPRWRELPNWFLVANQDHMIVPETQRFMAQRMRARIRTVEVDHTPRVTAPTAVVEIVSQAIAEVGTRCAGPERCRAVEGRNSSEGTQS